MDEIILVSSMAILVILAAFLSIVMNKIKFPPLIGFLAAGIIIANFMNLPQDAIDVVEVFSTLGLIMLMFSIGMEIDLRKLKTQGRLALIVAAVQLPLMVIGGLTAGLLLGYNMLQSFCLGAIISGSSTAVVLAVLKSQGTLDKESIELLVLVTIMEDIGQVIMLSILTPMLGGSEMSPDDLAILIIKIAIFMVACFTLGLYVVPRVIDWFYKRANDELISLLCIGGLFTLAWAAHGMGLSVAIGAFLMGIMVGTSRPKEAVEHFVEPLKSLFMAMFFISVGMEVAISSLVDNVGLILVIYAVFALCKTATVHLGYWVGNGDSRNGFISAVALCAMGEFAFIISKEALDYGVMDQAFYSSVIGAALLSMILLPILTEFSGKAYDRAGNVCPDIVRRFLNSLSAHRDELYRSLEAVSSKTRSLFNKGLAKSYFLVFLILLIQLVFFYLYNPLSLWLTEHFGMNEFVWRVVILVANFAILLFPCDRLASNIRMVLYILDIGNKKKPKKEESEEKTMFYETMNPLIIGAVIAMTAVILTPNGIDTVLHIIILIVILVAMAIYHMWKIKVGKKGPALPNIHEDQESEDVEA
jgi:CPA2 family monovalent cation:H+ antiporter-2